MLGVRALLRSLMEKRKDVLPHHLEHVRSRHVLEPRPPQIVVGSPPGPPLRVEVLPLRENHLIKRRPVRFALFSASVCRSSRPLMNSRYVSCSITSSGFDIPPDQKSFQTASIRPPQLPRNHHPPFQSKLSLRAPSPKATRIVWLAGEQALSDVAAGVG